MPPPPPEHEGSYPEDQEREDNKPFVDSSLSVNEVVAWIADEAPLGVVDSSDDEGIDGFGHGDPRGPAHILKSLDVQFSTSSWTRWDGIA